MVKVTVHSPSGNVYQFVDNGSPMQGGMKDVFFSPDKSYVVAFFRDDQDVNAKDRLNNIVNKYKDSIFNQPGGEYWKSLFCWPFDIVEHNGKLGVIVPVYNSCFFFQKGFNPGAANLSSIQGKEKEGKWFASSRYRNKNYKLHLDPVELGDWGKYIRICLNVSRAVARMHAAGLAHSDLSYKNVLIDPVTGSASIIDIDGLVVPGKYPPDVVGTPDFIAPEVLSTLSLPKKDPNKKLPSMLTDRHALAVMIYMFLLYRHPLKGGNYFGTGDSTEEDNLMMGSKALFIEHPTDKSNRPKQSQIDQRELPWADIDKIPYTICGPYLKQLFDRAFIEGLHNPVKRPTAEEWKEALIKTVDLMQPCQNPSCEQKWFVFDNKSKPVCPFCGTLYRGQLPILDLYYAPTSNNYKLENHRIMVYSGQNLYLWHVNRNITPNEKLTDVQRKPVGDFHFHKDKWILINRSLPDMMEMSADNQKKEVAIGTSVELSNDKKILLSKDPGGRLVIVKIVNN
jgi:serine/threonine protein kinase